MWWPQLIFLALFAFQTGSAIEAEWLSCTKCLIRDHVECIQSSNFGISNGSIIPNVLHYYQEIEGWKRQYYWTHHSQLDGVVADKYCVAGFTADCVVRVFALDKSLSATWKGGCFYENGLVYCSCNSKHYCNMNYLDWIDEAGDLFEAKNITMNCPPIMNDPHSSRKPFCEQVQVEATSTAADIFTANMAFNLKKAGLAKIYC